MKDFETGDFEELNNIITLTDEDGEEMKFEFLDLIEYMGNEYAVLFPVDEEDDTDTVCILRCEECDDPSEESYCEVESDEVLNAVYEIFKEKVKDEFDFTD